jgi:hypothetical protein
LVIYAIFRASRRFPFCAQPIKTINEKLSISRNLFMG